MCENGGSVNGIRLSDAGGPLIIILSAGKQTVGSWT